MTTTGEFIQCYPCSEVNLPQPKEERMATKDVISVLGPWDPEKRGEVGAPGMKGGEWKELG